MVVRALLFVLALVVFPSFVDVVPPLTKPFFQCLSAVALDLLLELLQDLAGCFVAVSGPKSLHHLRNGGMVILYLTPHVHQGTNLWQSN